VRSNRPPRYIFRVKEIGLPLPSISGSWVRVTLGARMCVCVCRAGLCMRRLCAGPSPCPNRPAKCQRITSSKRCEFEQTPKPRSVKADGGELTGGGCRLGSCGSGQNPVEGSCEHDHELSRSVQAEPTVSFPRWHLLSTDHVLIPARNASLASVHGSANGSNIRYYPTRKHSPPKKKMNNAVIMLKLSDVCS
jgi:hypothetical protein